MDFRGEFNLASNDIEKCFVYANIYKLKQVHVLNLISFGKSRSADGIEYFRNPLSPL